MRKVELLLFPVFVVVLSVYGVAAEVHKSPERPPDGDEASRFERTHKVPNVADGMRTIRLKDGSTLKVPVLVDITDHLVVWRCSSTDLCFSLTTYGQNGHQCEVHGVAVLRRQTEYLFSDRSCSIRFIRLSPDRLRIEPLGSELQDAVLWDVG